MQQDREYTIHEQQLLWKCIHFIQTRKGNVLSSSILNETTLPLMEITQSDSSPSGEESSIDMSASYVSNSSLELCSPDRVDIPTCWEAPAPPILPILQPLRLYVPEIEEIRISPVVARKGTYNHNF